MMQETEPPDEKAEWISVGKKEKEKVPLPVMLACGWPLVLVVVGGLVGGLLGGLACGVNIALYRSSLPRWSLWLLNPLVGLLALVLYFVVALGLSLAFME